MTEPRRSYARGEFNALMAGAGEPTPDDVSVLDDGRRLDTPAKVLAFVDELKKPNPDLDNLDLDNLDVDV